MKTINVYDAFEVAFDMIIKKSKRFNITDNAITKNNLALECIALAEYCEAIGYYVDIHYDYKIDRIKWVELIETQAVFGERITL